MVLYTRRTSWQMQGIVEMPQSYELLQTFSVA